MVCSFSEASRIESSGPQWIGQSTRSPKRSSITLPVFRLFFGLPRDLILSLSWCLALSFNTVTFWSFVRRSIVSGCTASSCAIGSLRAPVGLNVSLSICLSRTSPRSSTYSFSTISPVLSPVSRTLQASELFGSLIMSSDCLWGIGNPTILPTLASKAMSTTPRVENWLSATKVEKALKERVRRSQRQGQNHRGISVPTEQDSSKSLEKLTSTPPEAQPPSPFPLDTPSSSPLPSSSTGYPRKTITSRPIVATSQPTSTTSDHDADSCSDGRSDARVGLLHQAHRAEQADPVESFSLQKCCSLVSSSCPDAGQVSGT